MAPCELRKRMVWVCDDAMFDLLHFLQCADHRHVNLVSRRFRWLSASVAQRYPPRVIRALLVTGTIPRDQQKDGQRLSNSASDQLQLFVGNSISACPLVGPPYAVDFATVGPPATISRIAELEISDFIGPQLIQFLRVSAPLLDECCLIFDDFENFVQFHSVKFIVQFFALFPTNRSVELRFASSLTAPLFIQRPSLFECTEMGIECTADFPLDCLQGWLCQDEALEEGKRKRYLDIRFCVFVHVQHCLTAVQHFANSLRRRFLNAANCCPFIVEIELFGGPHIPELDTFTERNERTEECLAFTRDHLVRVYFLERRKRSIDDSGEERGGGDDQIDEGLGADDAEVVGSDLDYDEHALSMHRSVVFIRQITQGDISTG
uniref:F-box domain-containing protein n=1 Tax=Globodera rostochiensis TaxID=31243 RepID=A0A914I0S0_GLORO